VSLEAARVTQIGVICTWSCVDRRSLTHRRRASAAATQCGRSVPPTAVPQNLRGDALVRRKRRPRRPPGGQGSDALAASEACSTGHRL